MGLWNIPPAALRLRNSTARFVERLPWFCETPSGLVEGRRGATRGPCGTPSGLGNRAAGFVEHPPRPCGPPLGLAEQRRRAAQGERPPAALRGSHGACGTAPWGLWNTRRGRPWPFGGFWNSAPGFVEPPEACGTAPHGLSNTLPTASWKPFDLWNSAPGLMQNPPAVLWTPLGFVEQRPEATGGLCGPPWGGGVCNIPRAAL